MQKNIEQIIGEIYMIDEGLKKYDADIRRIVAAMIEARPDARIDRDFVSRLRKELADKAGDTAGERVASGGGIFVWRNLAYALSGAVLLFVMMLPFVDFGGRSPVKNILDPGGSSKTGVPGVVRLEQSAFGSLLATDGSPVADSSAAAPQPLALRSSDAEESAVSSRAIGMGGGGGGDVKMIAPAPDMANFEYKYTGGELSATGPALPVYRRSVSGISSAAVVNALGGLKIGLLDIAKLKSPGVDNISLIEDREFGYIIYANFRDGSFSLSMNWEKWPHPEQDCRDERCFEQYRLKAEDIPSDGEAIAVARAFLEGYGISVSGYGEPRVNDYWRRNYGIMDAQALAYVPESITVVFPEVIDGQTLYDESGNPSGLTVDVNIRYMKAAGMYNAFLPNYEKSDYAVVTDKGKIIEAAENGGLRPLYRYEGAGKTITVELGTPTLSLVRHWHYDESKNTSGEIYIPAYIFPILNPPAEIQNYYYNMESVIVPLPQEIFDQAGGNGFIGIPEPMPFIEGTAPAGGMEIRAIEPEEAAPDAVIPEELL